MAGKELIVLKTGVRLTVILDQTVFAPRDEALGDRRLRTRVREYFSIIRRRGAVLRLVAAVYPAYRDETLPVQAKRRVSKAACRGARLAAQVAPVTAMDRLDWSLERPSLSQRTVEVRGAIDQSDRKSVV